MRTEDEYPYRAAALPPKQRRNVLRVVRVSLAVAVVVSLFVAISFCQRIDAGVDGDHYELHFNGFLFGHRDLACRVRSTDPYVPALGLFGIADIPRAQIHGLDPVPIEIRYRDIFGLPHHGYVTLDVRKTLSEHLDMWMWEGQPWASYSSKVEPGKPVVVTFQSATDDCTIVRYGIDGDDVTQAVPYGQSTVSLPTLPRSVAVRYDLCSGDQLYEKLGPDGESLIQKKKL